VEGSLDFGDGPQQPGVDLARRRHPSVFHHFPEQRHADAQHRGGFVS